MLDNFKFYSLSSWFLKSSEGVHFTPWNNFIICWKIISFLRYSDTQKIKVNKNKTDQNVWKNREPVKWMTQNSLQKTTVWSNTSDTYVKYACTFITRIKTT